MFFINFLLDFVSELQYSKKRDRALKYLRMSISQLQLTQSFVSDLLDLKQIKDGVFNFSWEQFDPKEIFTQVCNIFNP